MYARQLLQKCLLSNFWINEAYDLGIKSVAV